MLDAFTPDLPAHLTGAFDIVHIRTLFSAVKDNAVEPLLGNVVKMLSESIHDISELMDVHYSHEARNTIGFILVKLGCTRKLLTCCTFQNQVATYNGMKAILLQLRHARRTEVFRTVHVPSLLDCLHTLQRCIF
jgi:hypothetical protein